MLKTRVFFGKTLVLLIWLMLGIPDSQAFSLKFATAFCGQIFNRIRFVPTDLTLPRPDLDTLRRKFSNFNGPIVIVSDAWTPQINGVVNTMQNLLRQMEALGIPVEMLVPDRFPHYTPQMAAAQDISLAWISEKKFQQLLALNPAAIYIATPEGTLGGRIAELLSERGIPFTTGFHTQFPEYVKDWVGLPIKLGYAWVRALHRNSNAILVPTLSQGHRLMEQGFDPKLLRLWSRGVDVERFRPQVRDPNFWNQLTLRLTQKSIVFEPPIQGYVGRVAQEKNLEAWLSLSLPGTKVVIGGGPKLNELRAKYPDAVFLGPITDKPLLAAAFAQMDVFVFPSLTDTYGNVLLEAAAAGVPSAAFSGPPSASVVEDNGIGVTGPDLEKNIVEALAMDRSTVAARVQNLSWRETTLLLLHYMHPIHYVVPNEP